MRARSPLRGVRCALCAVLLAAPSRLSPMSRVSAGKPFCFHLHSPRRQRSRHVPRVGAQVPLPLLPDEHGHSAHLRLSRRKPAHSRSARARRAVRSWLLGVSGHARARLPERPQPAAHHGGCALCTALRGECQPKCRVACGYALPLAAPSAPHQRRPPIPASPHSPLPPPYLRPRAESRTHFGAWCISSSPLILSHDLRNKAIADALWPIISNKEAIAINQVCCTPASRGGCAGGELCRAAARPLARLPAARPTASSCLHAFPLQAWAGSPGAPFNVAPKGASVLLHHGPVVGSAAARPGPPNKPRTRTDVPVSAPQWEAWHKPLDRGPGGEGSGPERIAVLLINNAPVEGSLFLDFAKVPGLGCSPPPGPPGPPGPKPGPGPGPAPGPGPEPTSCKVHVRDVWARKDLGAFEGGFMAKYVQSHDAVFLTLSRVRDARGAAASAEHAGAWAGGGAVALLRGSIYGRWGSAAVDASRAAVSDGSTDGGAGGFFGAALETVGNVQRALRRWLPVALR